MKKIWITKNGLMCDIIQHDEYLKEYVYYTVMNDKGIAVQLGDYSEITIPKECVGFSDRVYEDLMATADHRTKIEVEEGNPKYISAGNCLMEKETGRLVLGCRNSIIPDDGSVKIIGAHAFSGIRNEELWEYSDGAVEKPFTSVSLPESVEIIEHHAFADSDLENIEFPQNLKEIGSMAFMLTNLGREGRRICIPETVEKIGEGVFSGCKELWRLRASSASNDYKSESDCIYSAHTKTIVAVHCGRFAEILPQDAEKIEALTFMGQNSGTKYYIGDNIKEIKIHSLDMPSNIEFPIVIVTNEGSYAHKFALEHDIPFELR